MWAWKVGYMYTVVLLELFQSILAECDSFTRLCNGVFYECTDIFVYPIIYKIIFVLSVLKILNKLTFWYDNKGMFYFLKRTDVTYKLLRVSTWHCIRTWVCVIRNLISHVLPHVCTIYNSNNVFTDTQPFPFCKV